MNRLAPLLLLLPLIAACASTPDAPDETQELATQAVTVTINDTTPLAVYFNLDDVQCHAGQLGDAEIDPPAITIADGEGTILAVEDGPEIGGTFTEGQGCSVDVQFHDVPESGIYVVTITASTGEEFTATVQDSTSITVDA